VSELSPLREYKTTASQAPVIVNGSEQQLVELWEERCGIRPPKDFSRNIQVQRGRHDEPFILAWSELINEHPITERQTFIPHPTLPWCACTIDGYRAFDDAVYEAKCQSSFRRFEDVVAYYTPQVMVQRDCRGAARGILGVLQEDLQEVEIYTDEAYEREVWARLAAFQLCVETMTRPRSQSELVPPELWRTVNLLSENPNWGPDMRHELRMWADTREPARMHQKAKDSIKALLPPDVGTVLLGELSVKRSKNNAITVRGADR
jgi:hypothetical protein